LPGADSAGIDYTLTLSPDGGYKEVTLYLGKSPKPFQETGQWRIREDDIIVLNKPAPGHQMFKPDGNTLLVLDINGNEITGDLQGLYVLTKVEDSAAAALAKTDEKALDNVKWALVSFSGKKVKAAEFRSGLPYLEIDLSKSSFSGNTGCNKIGGTVSVEGTNIHFSDIFSTRMGCPGEFEAAYLRTLYEVDSYRLKDLVLDIKYRLDNYWFELEQGGKVKMVFKIQE